MASPPRDRRRQVLARLSPEVLSLILTELLVLDMASLFRLRLVCRRFDSLATSVAYHTVELNDALVHPCADRLYPRALDHVSLHTNHVVIRSDLDPQRVRAVLRRTRALSSIRWRHVLVPQSGAASLLADVLDLGHVDGDDSAILIENLPLGGVRRDLDDSYFHPALTARLVSLKLSISDPPLTTRPDSLKRLVLQSPRLRTLHYRDLGIGTSFSFAAAERMPPLADLVLKSYDWHHSPAEVARHWDFSRMRSLELVDMPVASFLDSVHLPDFARLRALRVDGYGGHLHDMRPSATRRLHDLVHHHAAALEALDVTCHTQLFGLDALARHAATLRVLRFRDHVGFGDDGKPCPTLPPEALAALASQLRHVHTLELDMDAALCRPHQFLEALCSFAGLHTLTLHVQTRIRPFDKIDPLMDRDYEAALASFRLLLRLRERQRQHGRRRRWQQQQQQQQQRPRPAWRRVVINVGGWRRAMVRRLGYEWKRRNEQGVFAERCFVLERDARSGRYGVREEAASEGLWCRPRPPLQL